MTAEILKTDTNGNAVLGGVSETSGEVRNLRVDELTSALEVAVVSAKGLKAGVTQSGAWFVGVNSLPMLPTGNNYIGKVGIQTLPPLPAGSNTIGKVGINGITCLDPKVNNLLTNATTVGQYPTVTCVHAYKTFTFGLTGDGAARITLFGSADGSIYVPLAVFALDSLTTPADGISSGATSYTKFYVTVSDITGNPILNGSVMGVF